MINPLIDLETFKAFVKARIDKSTERSWAEMGVCTNAQGKCPVCEAVGYDSVMAWNAMSEYLDRALTPGEDDIVTDFVDWVDYNPEEVQAWIQA